MLFREVEAGQNFKKVGPSNKVLKKIQPIDDKWGNLFVAVDCLGKLYATEEVPETVEVELNDERI